MKITVRKQILTGNLNEGFSLTEYLPALQTIWESRIQDKYPSAEIEFDIDVQNASGYSCELSVEVEDDDGEWSEDDQIQPWLVHDAETLADDPRWYE